LSQKISNLNDRPFNPNLDPLLDHQGERSGVINDIKKQNSDPLLPTTSECVVCESESKEFVIGDLHFFHNDIILTAPREFNSVEEMNLHMITKWNSVVGNKDTVFVLGDFFDFNNCTQCEAYEILDQLNGNIVLIAGNHDDHLEYFREYGITVIEYPIIKDGFWLLSHAPMFVSEASPYANIFAHVHLNPMYRTVSSRSFCASAERIGYTPILLSEIKKMVRREAQMQTMFKKNGNIEIG
jgi:calcineurin-like phosphoesterase family protein